MNALFPLELTLRGKTFQDSKPKPNPGFFFRVRVGGVTPVWAPDVTTQPSDPLSALRIPGTARSSLRPGCSGPHSLFSHGALSLRSRVTVRPTPRPASGFGERAPACRGRGGGGAGGARPALTGSYRGWSRGSGLGAGLGQAGWARVLVPAAAERGSAAPRPQFFKEKLIS